MCLSSLLGVIVQICKLSAAGKPSACHALLARRWLDGAAMIALCRRRLSHAGSDSGRRESAGFFRGGLAGRGGCRSPRAVRSADWRPGRASGLADFCFPNGCPEPCHRIRRSGCRWSAFCLLRRGGMPGARARAFRGGPFCGFVCMRHGTVSFGPQCRRRKP
jgi:hypothetical protein